MSVYILNKAYSIDEQEGVGMYKCVVNGDNPGDCKLPPAGIHNKTFLGITTHSQQCRGTNVAVRKAGIAKVMASGKIRLGAPVMMAVDGSGKVVEIIEPAFNDQLHGAWLVFNFLDDDQCMVECIGFAETPAEKDGDIIKVFISMHQRLAVR